MSTTYSVKIVESGFINKVLEIPIPAESELITEIEAGLASVNAELDGSVTVTKNGKGGFNIAVTIKVNALPVESFDLTEPAMAGIPGFLEGVFIGQGKTFEAKVTLVATTV